ncbi:MAG: hypothetical protein AMS20_17835 [Gemmatimonas sp. SG8_28]|nr:MAG: hypothetical protein AMS20_17835 [Gemmatimonas sp. SG8_28]
MRYVCVQVALMLMVASAAAAQEQRAADGLDVAAQVVWSHQLLGAGAPDERTIGVGAALGYRFPVRVALEMRGSYRSWEDETYVPLHLGVRYDLPVLSVVTLVPFAGVGPCLVTGGDWGSVFASFDAGARVQIALGRGAAVRLLLEASYARAMAFHPSAFDVVNAGAGLQIGL